MPQVSLRNSPARTRRIHQEWKTALANPATCSQKVTGILVTGSESVQPDMVAANMLARASYQLRLLEETIDAYRKMLDSPTATPEAIERAAVNLGHLSKAHGEKTKEIMALAKEAHAKAGSGKPKNKPPQLAMQINVAPGGHAEVSSANNGGTQAVHGR